MLHLVTGVPGATKTAYVVTQLDKIETANKVNLVKNLQAHQHNQSLFEKYKDDLTYYDYEVGSGHQLKRQIDILDDDYFDFLNQEFDDLRPDYYFKRTVQLNEIIERITKRDGEQGFKFYLPVRTIYTNINALKIDFVRANVYDWRECPDGSIIVIDEVQLVDPYDNIKDKENRIVQDLTIHRHRGFDFWFITQSPTLLHPTVKVLIGVHYHLTRPYGMKTVVYQFGSCKDNPNAMVNRQNVESKFFFTPQDRIFKLYKSTTINTHKKRFPKGIWFFVAWVVLGIAFFIYNIMQGDYKKLAVGNESIVTTEQAKSVSAQNIEQGAKNVISATLDTATQTSQQTTQYTPPPPIPTQAELERKYLPAYTVEVANIDTVRPALVAQMGNECRAYNQYGDLLNIDDDLCKKMLKEYGLKPRARQVFNDYTNNQYENQYNDPHNNAIQPPTSSQTPSVDTNVPTTNTNATTSDNGDLSNL